MGLVTHLQESHAGDKCLVLSWLECVCLISSRILWLFTGLGEHPWTVQLCVHPYITTVLFIKQDQFLLLIFLCLVELVWVEYLISITLQNDLKFDCKSVKQKARLTHLAIRNLSWTFNHTSIALVVKLCIFLKMEEIIKYAWPSEKPYPKVKFDLSGHYNFDICVWSSRMRIFKCYNAPL